MRVFEAEWRISENYYWLTSYVRGPRNLRWTTLSWVVDFDTCGSRCTRNIKLFFLLVSKHQISKQKGDTVIAICNIHPIYSEIKERLKRLFADFPWKSGGDDFRMLTSWRHIFRRAAWLSWSSLILAPPSPFVNSREPFSGIKFLIRISICFMLFANVVLHRGEDRKCSSHGNVSAHA